MNSDLNIVLVGMSGCGKTTIGELLAKELNKSFIDVDQYVEKQQGKTIPEIFKNGEAFFREIESNAVVEVSQKKGNVISTGGGVIKIEANMVELSKNSIIIFIDRPIDKILADIDDTSRPLIKNNKSYLYDLHKERYPLYKKFSDYTVVNDSSEEEVLNRIVEICLR